MEHYGEPLGILPEDRESDYGGYGKADGLEQKHHADHAEENDGQGADCMQGQWADEGLHSPDRAGGGREEGNGELSEKGVSGKCQYAGQRFCGKAETEPRGTGAAARHFGQSRGRTE